MVGTVVGIACSGRDGAGMVCSGRDGARDDMQW